MVDDPSPPEVPGQQTAQAVLPGGHRNERLHSGLAGHFQPKAHTKYPKLPSFDPMCFPRETPSKKESVTGLNRDLARLYLN
jgi:hypothetical protein